MTRDPSLYVKNEETGLFFIREGVRIDADTKLAETIWLSKTADQTMRLDQKWFADRFGCKAKIGRAHV